MVQSRECPKCASSMSSGFLVDKGDHGSMAVSAWVEGEPTKSIWTGLKLGGRTPVPITTWRCRRCGYLENYAPE